MASKSKASAASRTADLIENISPLQVALILFLLMALLGAMFYFNIYKEQDKELVNINTQLTQVNSRRAELDDKRRNLLEIQKRAKALELNLERLRAQLPNSQEELDEFLSAISQRGQNARVASWLRFEQLDLEADGQVDRVPIELEFVATYEAANQFFWELSEMGQDLKTGGREQIVNVKSVTISRNANLDDGLLQIACTAETFLYRDGAQPAGDDDSRRRRRRRGSK